MFKRLWSTIGRLWCMLMHDSVMWPVHDRYECRACGCRYPAFAEAAPAIGMKTFYPIQSNSYSSVSSPERPRRLRIAA